MRRRDFLKGIAAAGLVMGCAPVIAPRFDYTGGYNLTLKDMISTLSEYDVVHTENDIPNGAPSEIVDMENRKIEISSRWGPDEVMKSVTRAFFRVKYPNIPEGILHQEANTYARDVWKRLRETQHRDVFYTAEPHEGWYKLRAFTDETGRLELTSDSVIAILSGLSAIETRYYGVEHCENLEKMRPETDITGSDLGIILGVFHQKHRKIYIAREEAARLRYDRSVEHTVIHEALHGVERMTGVDRFEWSRERKMARERELDKRAMEIYNELYKSNSKKLHE